MNRWIFFLAWVCTACSNSESGPSGSDAGNDAARTGSGGTSSASGGQTGSGGSPSTATGGGAGASTSGGAGASTSGGSAGAGGDPYQCQAQVAANPPDPGGSAKQGASCCGGLGTCALHGAITLAVKDSLGHDACQASTGDDDLRCAPTTGLLASDGGPSRFFDVCQARAGDVVLEGRCVPRCFVAGNPGVLLLTSSGCADDDGGAEVCAPCYDPVDGTATGACSMRPGDHPTEPAPAPFKECGQYGDADALPGGVCMPKTLALASGDPAVPNLPQDVCAASEICVPKLKAADPTACFQQCETSPVVQAAGSKAGGCVPAYIVGASNPDAEPLLRRGPCAPGELCAPCLDPTKKFAATGACQ